METLKPSDFTSTQEIIARHRGHYFDRGTQRFFRPRVLWQVFPGKTEVYFVTSEQFVDSQGNRALRKYTVRAYDPATDNIRTVPPFNQLTRCRALRIARDLAQTVGQEA